MNTPDLPTATYRLQFNCDFTFADAIRVIPYLHRLGISHIYASPFLKARAGSPHGYDIVDHSTLNPEIGDTASFTAYVETLHAHGMGQILDIVPNHMGVGGDDNAWWLDVLENGEASIYAPYFDIDWRPPNPALRNKILLPFLGDHYGAILEQGDLKLSFDAGNGCFCVRYYEHLFPIDPRTWPGILNFRIETLQQRLQHAPALFNRFTALIKDCRSLPARTDLSTLRRQQRHRHIQACKTNLAELCRQHPDIIAFIADNVVLFNGTVGQSRSFDQLHRLLEAQAYRLAYWQVASDDINYRRFFDINDLAGIRMEVPEVFQATHRFVAELIHKGQVNGLRIDHPDGLYDPYSYYHDLHRLIDQARESRAPSPGDHFYLVVEKILASYEHMPTDWPVAGTTGYDAACLLNGLFIYPGAEPGLNRLYSQFTGQDTDFDELLYDRKKLIIRRVLSSELTVLANLLNGIAQAERHTRDFTYYGLRNALTEIVACFPVYRTYINEQRVSEEDRRYVQWAIAQAKKRTTAAEILIFDFIHRMLIPSNLKRYSPNRWRRVIRFALRFQQYTAAVMAKALEDTTFYIYNRLVSLNDVGFDPRNFGVSLNAFHHENKQRLLDWPHAMVASSTHDSKRSEDLRMRINVLTEIYDDWRQHLRRWARINRNKKLLVNDERAPSRNDEYLLYQTLIGTWPSEALDDSGLARFRKRIETYMLKAIKEAKVYTSWINPNLEYEEAMSHFVHALLDDPERNAFLTDFLPLQKQIARFGRLNSLSQTLLKLTVPGVPDIYQGNELSLFNLVDPDNRKPVDYPRRDRLLQTFIEHFSSNRISDELLVEFSGQIDGGRAKLFLSWKALSLRRQYPELFIDGDYVRLTAEGPGSDHICAFARCLDDMQVVVVVTRWFARLEREGNGVPAASLWNDTRILSHEATLAGHYKNILTNEPVSRHQQEDDTWFNAAELLRCLPMALLVND